MMARRKQSTRPRPVLRPADGPTLERLSHAAKDDIAIGDDGKGARIYTINLRPIVSMLNRGQVSGKQFAALDRFHRHWFNGRLSGSVASVDCNRVYAPDPYANAFMNASERQEENRRHYNAALKLLSHSEGIIATNLILSETMTVEQCGHAWYSSPYRARQAGIEIVCGIADKFIQLWEK